MEEPNNEFEEILKHNDMLDMYNDSQKFLLTLGDLYEGLAIISSVQADLHNYLHAVVRAIQSNNRAGQNINEIPQLKASQASQLIQIFELGGMFLEETIVE